MSEQKPSRGSGIGRILWPLLLALLLLIAWLSYWPSTDFLNFGSSAEIDAETASDAVAVSDDAAADNSDANSESDQASSDATTADSDGEQAADSDSDTSDIGGEGDANSNDADSAADVSGDGATDNDEPETDEPETDAAQAAADSNVTAGDNAANDASNTDASTTDASTTNATGAASDSVTGRSATPFSLALNSVLTVADAAADTADSGLRLYATVSFDSPTREVYAPGALFTLIEPSEDFETYPIEVDGVSWVRVRDSDGLLGWTDLSLLDVKP